MRGLGVACVRQYHLQSSILSDRKYLLLLLHVFYVKTKILWKILFQFSLEQTHLRVEPLMENPIMDDLVLCKGHVLLGLSGAQVSQRGLGIAHSSG